jgi:hypothetical protein
MANLSPKVRMVVWTGKKFLFLGEEDFRKISKTMGLSAVSSTPVVDCFGKIYTTEHENDTSFLRIIPTSVSVSNNFDGTGSASIDVTASQYPSPKLDFREKESRYQAFADSGMSDYYYSFVARHLYPHLDVYKKMSTFSGNVLLPSELTSGLSDPSALAVYLKSVSEPIHLFSPPQLVWVMMQRDDSEPWHKVFTGVINDVSMNEGVGGTSRTFRIQCSNLLQYLTKIPIITSKINNLGSSLLLSSLSAEERSFIKVYLSSVFVDSDVTTFDALGALSWSDIMYHMAKLVNRCFGSVSQIDYDEMVASLSSSDTQKKLNTLEWVSAGYGLPDDADYRAYYNFCKKNSFFRFKLINDRKVEDESWVYEKVSTEVPDEMGLLDLFEYSPGVGYTIGRVMFNRDFISVDSDKIHPTPFKKLIKPLLEVMSAPKQAMVSSVIRQFSTSMMAWVHTDGVGNWVTEFPKFNTLPSMTGDLIGPVENEKTSGGYIGYDETYFLHKPFQIENYSETESPESLVTYLELPYGIHQIDNIAAPVTNSLMTGRTIDMKNLLLFGMNTIISEQFFGNAGDLPLYTSSTGEKVGAIFLSKVAELQRIFHSKDVFSATAGLRLSPAFQIGRNAIIVHRERMYMIEGVSHTITPGKTATTSLTLKYGRPLRVEIVNPWQYFSDNIDDIKYVIPPSAATESTLAVSQEPSQEDVDACCGAYGIPSLPVEDWTASVVDTQNGYFEYTNAEVGIRMKSVGAALVSDLLRLRNAMKTYLSSKLNLAENGKFSLIISSSFRPIVNPGAPVSNHSLGRAVDVAGVSYTAKEGSSSIITHPRELRLDATATGGNPVLIGDAFTTCLQNLGYHWSQAYTYKGDSDGLVFIYNVTDSRELAKFSSCDDPGHLYHIHINNLKAFTG